MDLEPVVTMLTEAELGKRAQSIFITEMPAGVDGILLMDNYYGTAVNHYLPGYYVTEFRAVIRSKDHTAGKTLAKAVFDTLTIKGDQAVGDITIKQMLPQNLPRPYRRSNGAYWEFEIDIEIRFVVT